MTLDHFLARPPMPQDAATLAAFERLYQDVVARGTGAAIEYRLAAPKWQFLCYLADTKPMVLHGSGEADIQVFEPRQSNDVDDFGNRQAVYAARDGLWPMYFAVVDRSRYRLALLNACVNVTAPRDVAGAYYFFSIGGEAMPQAPWRPGTIYLLPDSTFERQAIQSPPGLVLESTQVASLVPVRPLAQLAIEAEDFPFLNQVRRHDPGEVLRRARANPDGFPWLDP